MNSALLTALTAGLLFAAPVRVPGTDEEVRLPRGPQPRQALARVNNDQLILTEAQTVYVQQQRTVQEVVEGRVVQRTVTVAVPVVQTVEVKHALKDVRAFGTDGKKVEAKAVAEALDKRKPVLVSADGRPVDPFYLKIIKEGTLVLVLPSPAVTPPPPVPPPPGTPVPVPKK
jgi:hypothetical protein